MSNMEAGLIETWDVLKFFGSIFLVRISTINRNMRFIEMPVPKSFDFCTVTINRNMRCIEMLQSEDRVHRLGRLIETWDVLKWYSTAYRPGKWWWLIETWDVLKFHFLPPPIIVLRD